MYSPAYTDYAPLDCDNALLVDERELHIKVNLQMWVQKVGQTGFYSQIKIAIMILSNAIIILPACPHPQLFKIQIV